MNKIKRIRFLITFCSLTINKNLYSNRICVNVLVVNCFVFTLIIFLSWQWFMIWFYMFHIFTESFYWTLDSIFRFTEQSKTVLIERQESVDAFISKYIRFIFSFWSMIDKNISLKTSNKRKESFKFEIYIYCMLIRNVCVCTYIHTLSSLFCLVSLFSSPNTAICSYIDSDDIHILRSRLNASTRFVILRAHHPYI